MPNSAESPVMPSNIFSPQSGDQDDYKQVLNHLSQLALAIAAENISKRIEHVILEKRHG